MPHGIATTTGRLVEKYDVRAGAQGAGGEYPVQDGFGWTCGVLIKLLALYPQLGRARHEFGAPDCAVSPR